MARARTSSGRYREKNGNTDLGNLRKVYPELNKISGPANKHLHTVLVDEGAPSLTKLLDRL
jgi:hypothetical protein